jgi:mono/diheme cytochrome c family protein
VVYDRYCAICHGTTGGGDGFNAYNLKSAFNVTPTAFGDSTVFHALPQDSALAMIRDGGATVGRSPAMPPWGKTLTPGEIVDVWQYIRSLSQGASKD